MRFLEKIGKETLTTFTTEDFLVLDRVHREISIPSTPIELKIRLKHLIDMGIIESIGRGRSIRYLLCQRYYAFAGKGGVYTRRKGLDKETNKELLLRHIKLSSKNGTTLTELCQVLPALSKRQVQELLRELKKQNQIHFKGKTKASLWFPGVE